ncbi:MAG: GntR family transcriptional regulator [Acidobacteriota bacterium]
MGTKSDEIVRVLEEQIINCDLEPGASLFEAELSDRFQVSRTPIREAFLKLERRGLIRSVPYKGFAVNPILLRDVFELYEFRMVIEVYTAGVACRKMDSKTRSRLQQLLSKRYDDQRMESQKEFMRDDHIFHLSLADLTGNRRIHAILSDILRHLQRIYYLGLKNHLGRASHAEHRQILEAILAGQPERSRQLMQEHISLSKQRVLKALE